jgi:hypothetical protein
LTWLMPIGLRNSSRSILTRVYGDETSPDMLAAMPKRPSHILELAKRGAEARLQDLRQEAKLLLQLFPHLRDAFDKDELPVSFIIAKGSGRLTKRAGARKRPRLSVAARKAVSRMKKYRAAKRKAKKP